MSLKSFKAEVLRGARAKRLGIAPSKPRPRSVAEVQQQWINDMTPRSEAQRVARARSLSVDPLADPLTQAFGGTYAKVYDLKAEAVRRHAYIEQLRREQSGPAVIHGDPDRDRKLAQAIKQLEGELANVMAEIKILEKPGRHVQAAEEAEEYFAQQATNEGKIAAHAAAVEKAQQDLADERLAERARELAEAATAANVSNN